MNCVGKARTEPAGNLSSSGLAKAAINGHIEVVDLLLTKHSLRLLPIVQSTMNEARVVGVESATRGQKLFPYVRPVLVILTYGGEEELD